MEELTDLVWLVPLFPLVGFSLLVIFGKTLGEPKAGWLATTAILGSFLSSGLVLMGLLARDASDRIVVVDIYTWVAAGDLRVDIAFLVDPLSVTMIMFITGIGTLIHLYSIGYMHGDPGFSRYFVYLNLFAFSMLMLVLGDNLLVTFLGWEGVGACSYFLISFWFTDEANATAGKKAFITNRVGDFGFMLAMFLAFLTFGTLNYGGMFSGTASMVVASAIVLLLFLGATGKSAQIPLYLWLPDAMAGPTPVSALIHAATMVTAGVYLMIRVNPITAMADTWVPDLIAWVGVATALGAATVAIAQKDIKKVLAYSTVSQLGFMFVAVGTGAYVAAIFHMVAHAFFKALLFLGSGSVIHAMDDEQDMENYGGLAKYMPITATTMAVAGLALAGIPPMAGFWTKDEILVHAFQESKVMWILMLFAALMTAFYMTRLWVLTFMGRPRFDTDESHPHDAGWTMTLPLVILAVGSIVVAILNLPFSDDLHYLEKFLEPSLFGNEVHLDLATLTIWLVAFVAVVVATFGLFAAYMVYARRKVDPVRIEKPLFRRGWYYDQAVSWFMGGPGRRGFEDVTWFDEHIIDGAVEGTARDVRTAGGLLRHLQNGMVRTYAVAIALGAVLLGVYFLLRATF
jgi:NADH-quinone oxidoreductase subunit L